MHRKSALRRSLLQQAVLEGHCECHKRQRQTLAAPPWRRGLSYAGKTWLFAPVLGHWCSKHVKTCCIADEMSDGATTW